MRQIKLMRKDRKICILYFQQLPNVKYQSWSCYNKQQIVMWQYIISIFVVLVLGGLYWIIQPYLVWRKSSKAINHTAQKLTIIDTQQKTSTLAQHLKNKENKKLALSLVVPSYNEESRLPIMLDESINFLKSMKINYQILVVNDGSKDKTTEAALKKGKELGADLYVVEYPKNRGKGGAVRAGMAAAGGERILMVDADGATTFSELTKVNKKMDEIQEKVKHPLIMVVGSRKHLEQQSKVQRKIHRKIVSAVFGFIKKIVCGVKTEDTQCGFKLFTKQSAKVLFSVLHIERWAFDIELFVLSSIFNVQIGEVPVEWKDVDGSKLNVIQASLNMFRDVLMIKLLYVLRLWKRTDRVMIQ